MSKFLITNFESIDELFEAAYEEVLDNGYTEEIGRASCRERV